LKTLAPRKKKGTELEVFTGKAARANLAIFEALAKESPKNIKQIRKQIGRRPGLQETYYASLTKRLRNLQETGYVTEAKSPQENAKAQAYQLKMKAYLATFLNSYSMQEILDKATDTQIAQILLILLDIVLSEKS
jgi:DNA-binding HxlR family transcriptional regulator